jgi:DNA-binding TFAR19-related protein (PDSD5 family)
MSDDKDLEIWRRRRLLEMKRKMFSKKSDEESEKEKKPETIKKGVEDSLKSIMKGRAGEVLETARHQFPKETARLEEELVRLSSTGEIKDGINGEQLLWIFRAVGLNVRMKTKIRVHEDGKLKTISEKIRNK